MTIQRTTRFLTAFFVFLVSSLPLLSLAHTGHGSTQGFTTGFLHPLSGMDHLLAMVAVGLWAIQIGGRSVWMLPVSFLLAMTLGGAIGFMGISLPFVEQGIIYSVIFLGWAIAAAVRAPGLLGVLSVAFFALFHGHAHGAEMPVSLSPAGLGPITYTLGFLSATTLLHLSGLGLAFGIGQFRWPKVLRATGVAIALIGITLV